MLARAAPGRELGPWTVPVKATTLGRLASATGTTPDAAGPALAGNLCVGLFFHALPRHVLHTRQVVTAHGVAAVGDELVVHGTVSSLGARRGRAYVTISGDVRRGGAVLWEVEAECVVPGASAAGLREADRTPLVPPEVPPAAALGRRLTLGDQLSFSGRGNFHSEADLARDAGYEHPVAQGMHVAAVGFPLLPAPWPGAGTVELRFTDLAFPGDALIAEVVPSAGGAWLRVRAGDTVAVVGRFGRGDAGTAVPSPDAQLPREPS